MVVALNTKLCPQTLLYHCQMIEQAHQRVRKKHWGPRTLDIDILLYGQHIIKQAHLIIPHPHMLLRDFVLVPLLEISPKLQMPTKELVSTYVSQCKRHLT